MAARDDRVNGSRDAATAPAQVFAAAIAATQEGAWAMSRAASEAGWGFVTLYVQQAQAVIAWSEITGKTLAALCDSKALDELVQANAALVRAQGRQALDAAKAVIERFDTDRPPISPAPIAGAQCPTSEDPMKISECMTRDVQLADPNDTIAEAAKAMARLDAGVLPVGQNDRLVGMITDRDIAIRAVAQGKGPDAKVAEVMSAEVKYCFDDQEVDDVLHNVGELQVRRLPVLNHDKRLVGIVSLGDLAGNSHAQPTAEALSGISRPGGQHSQTAHRTGDARSP